MKVYQIVNDAFQPVPHLPFAAERDAVAYIKALQETYNSTFHVIELNVTSSILPPRTGK